MSILNNTGDLYPAPTDGGKAKNKIDFKQPAASGKKSNALVGSDYNVAPLPTSKASNARGYTVKPKLAPMDSGRKKQTFGPGSDMGSY